MRVILRDMNGQEYRIDTPDPQFIGPWLKMLFDAWAADKDNFRPAYMPIQFQLEIR